MNKEEILRRLNSIVSKWYGGASYDDVASISTKISDLVNFFKYSNIGEADQMAYNSIVQSLESQLDAMNPTIRGKLDKIIYDFGIDALSLDELKQQLSELYNIFENIGLNGSQQGEKLAVNNNSKLFLEQKIREIREAIDNPRVELSTAEVEFLEDMLAKLNGNLTKTLDNEKQLTEDLSEIEKTIERLNGLRNDVSEKKESLETQLESLMITDDEKKKIRAQIKNFEAIIALHDSSIDGDGKRKTKKGTQIKNTRTEIENIRKSIEEKQALLDSYKKMNMASVAADKEKLLEILDKLERALAILSVGDEMLNYRIGDEINGLIAGVKIENETPELPKDPPYVENFSAATPEQMQQGEVQRGKLNQFMQFAKKYGFPIVMGIVAVGIVAVGIVSEIKGTSKLVRNNRVVPANRLEQAQKGNYEIPIIHTNGGEDSVYSLVEEQWDDKPPFPSYDEPYDNYEDVADDWEEMVTPAPKPTVQPEPEVIPTPEVLAGETYINDGQVVIDNSGGANNDIIQSEIKKNDVGTTQSASSQFFGDGSFDPATLAAILEEEVKSR